ncbi:MAG: hypothetical protein ACPL7K_00230 [Armatimonadota bacterium]
MLGSLPADSPDLSFAKGLISLLHYRDVILNGGGLWDAWSHLLSAVQRLELAVCQNPNDQRRRLNLERAVDLFDGLSGALLGKLDPDFAEFEQNTLDAALQKLVPEGPLNRLVQRADGESVLHEISKRAYDALFDHARTPLRGEFLVSVTDGHHVLTNYRLLLTTDRLPAPQLLPLNVITRFTERAEGISVACVLIDIGGGRQLALNNMPRGTYPPERLVNYLIAARMWERLVPDEQEVLERGRDRSPGTQASLSGDAAPFASLPRQAAVACLNCGAAANAGDVFCRSCGARLQQALTDGSSPMLSPEVKR